MDRVVAGPVQGEQRGQPSGTHGCNHDHLPGVYTRGGPEPANTTRSRSKRRATRSASVWLPSVMTVKCKLRAAVHRSHSRVVPRVRRWPPSRRQRSNWRASGPSVSSVAQSRATEGPDPVVTRIARARRSRPDPQFRLRGDDGRAGPPEETHPWAPARVSPRVAAGHVPATSAREILVWQPFRLRVSSAHRPNLGGGRSGLPCRHRGPHGPRYLSPLDGARDAMFVPASSTYCTRQPRGTIGPWNLKKLSDDGSLNRKAALRNRNRDVHAGEGKRHLSQVAQRDNCAHRSGAAPSALFAPGRDEPGPPISWRRQCWHVRSAPALPACRPVLRNLRR